MVDLSGLMEKKNTFETKYPFLLTLYLPAFFTLENPAFFTVKAFF